MTGASLEETLRTARHNHVIPGREIHMQGLRGYRFCELGLVTGTPRGNAIANVWNTTGACDPEPEHLGALDVDMLARQNGALQAWLSSARHWLIDRLDVREVGDDRTFGSITMTWMGVADVATMMQTTIQGSYDPGYIHRDNTITFSKGTEVFVLDAPDGEVFILESLARHWDHTVSEASLASLGSQLDLPAGWGFRAVVLDQDLEITSNPHKLAHMMQDNLHNLYQGSDVGRAFSRLAPQDPRW
jgi:hypothetical protein